MEKIKEYIKKHKISLSILMGLLVVAIIFALVQLETTYDFVVEQYETFPDDIQTCEDGVTALSRMKYYRNSRNYIRQMKRSVIENYCKMGQFDEAKKYLDKNYEKDLEELYDKIEEERAAYEEEQRVAKYNSSEGRTERVEKMYKEMGLGGCDYADYVLDTLALHLQGTTLHDLEYILPVWNRNETYFEMMVKDIMQGNFLDLESGSVIYYIKDYKVDEDIKYSASQYKRYLHETYNIDINVQDVAIYSYMAWVQDGQVGNGDTNYMIVFKTEDKWFFGGIISRDSQNFGSIIPASSQYNGELIDE